MTGCEPLRLAALPMRGCSRIPWKLRMVEATGPGAARDEAVVHFATMLVPQDPETALAWRQHSQTQSSARPRWKNSQAAGLSGTRSRSAMLTGTNALAVDVKQRLLQTP
jgi:hypothetical protein